MVVAILGRRAPSRSHCTRASICAAISLALPRDVSPTMYQPRCCTSAIGTSAPTNKPKSRARVVSVRRRVMRSVELTQPERRQAGVARRSHWTRFWRFATSHSNVDDTWPTIDSHATIFPPTVFPPRCAPPLGAPRADGAARLASAPCSTSLSSIGCSVCRWNPRHPRAGPSECRSPSATPDTLSSAGATGSSG